VDDKAQDKTEAARAQARRDRLRGLMDRLEVALAEPTRRDPDRWRDQVLVVAADLETGLIDHVAETEARGGSSTTSHVMPPDLRIGSASCATITRPCSMSWASCGRRSTKMFSPTKPSPRRDARVSQFSVSLSRTVS
jgi:hypothetical protein